MELLKLVALDSEDLEIISAHLQDAVLRVGDMAYLPAEHRFAAIANRFDWEGAIDKNKEQLDTYHRRRSALRFDRVMNAQLQNIKIGDGDAVLELLAIQFEEKESPEGFITLVFAGGGAVRLHVECIESELKDLGPVWQTKSQPVHEEDQAESTDAESNGE